jgi:hypothetical protein
MQIGSVDKSNLAKTDGEFLELVKSDVDWIARSADDMWQLRDAEFGPFGKLPEDDFREFVASLEFNGGGVSTGSYRPLMRSLSLTELFEVFECFGMHQGLFLGGRDHKCVHLEPPEGSNCEFTWGYFCTPACEGIFNI